MSLRNKLPRVPDRLSAWVPKCPLSARVHKCLSVQVPKCLQCLIAQVSLECPSAWSAQVPKCLECHSAQVLFECSSVLSALSAGVLTCPSSALSSRVPWVPWVPKCLSQSVSQPASQSAGLQCWFSKLISTLRTHTLREDIILRLKKLGTVV